jgi:hypothetical protein
MHYTPKNKILLESYLEERFEKIKMLKYDHFRFEKVGQWILFKSKNFINNVFIKFRQS